MIGASLGHSQPRTPARYAHLMGDPVKQAADTVDQRFTGAMRRPVEGAIPVLQDA